MEKELCRIEPRLNPTGHIKGYKIKYLSSGVEENITAKEIKLLVGTNVIELTNYVITPGGKLIDVPDKIEMNKKLHDLEEYYREIYNDTKANYDSLVLLMSLSGVVDEENLKIPDSKYDGELTFIKSLDMLVLNKDLNFINDKFYIEKFDIANQVVNVYPLWSTVPINAIMKYGSHQMRKTEIIQYSHIVTRVNVGLVFADDHLFFALLCKSIGMYGLERYTIDGRFEKLSYLNLMNRAGI